MSLTAVCHRCGGAKPDAMAPCPDCGHVPLGDDRLLAWLFSDAHLSEDELAEAAARVSAGEHPDPGRARLNEARRALGAELPAARRGPPLRPGERAALLGANLLLTPLAGFAVWFGLRADRPAAARDALLLTIPVTVFTALVWAGVVAWRLV